MSTMTCARQRSDLTWLQPTLSQLLKQYISFGQSVYLWQTTLETKPQNTLCDRISELPPEITRMILLHLLSTSHSSFLQALRVSQSWAEIGTPLLWRNIALDSAHINRFLQSLAQPTHSIKSIQSLTLSMSMQTFPETDLTNLSQTVNRLENLSTFSFSIHSNRFCKVRSISKLLSSVPSTVTALEIGGLPPRLYCKAVSDNVCNAIQHLLPQLEHLRIDRGHVCSAILPDLDPNTELHLDPTKKALQIFPRLKSVLINDSNRTITSSHCCRLRDTPEWRLDLIGEQIALKARRLLDASAMPALETFIVLTTCRYQPRSHSLTPTPFSIPSPPPLSSSAEIAPSSQPTATTTALTSVERLKSFLSSQAANCFLRKDVIGNETTIHPYYAAPHAQHKWVIQQPHCYYYSSSSDPVAAAGRPKDKTMYFVGDISDIRAIPEGDKTWIETSAGARFPPSFRQTRQGLALMGADDKKTWNQQLSVLAAGTLDSQCRDGELQYLKGLGADDANGNDTYDILNPATYAGLLRPCLE